MPTIAGLILGLATAIYRVSDLASSKVWYTEVFGVKPYFDEPFYVGFNIAGYEFGLNLSKTVDPGPGRSVAYCRVGNIDYAVEGFYKAGAVVRSPIHNVDGGIGVA
jgi:predicted enzyme related to lactoylglutathione lyase